MQLGNYNFTLTAITPAHAKVESFTVDNKQGVPAFDLYINTSPGYVGLFTTCRGSRCPISLADDLTDPKTRGLAIMREFNKATAEFGHALFKMRMLSDDLSVGNTLEENVEKLTISYQRDGEKGTNMLQRLIAIADRDQVFIPLTMKPEGCLQNG